jgi:hypothetical protein
MWDQKWGIYYNDMDNKKWTTLVQVYFLSFFLGAKKWQLDLRF